MLTVFVSSLGIAVEVDERFVRASGPGGQNVNKVSSAVQLRFDVGAAALPADVKSRLAAVAGTRMTADGILVIDSREHRTQIQNRVAKASGRRMLSKDMSAWTAARIVGEAATRTRSDNPQTIADYIRSDNFSIAAFKGQKLTFRKWNQQLRQPIFLGDSKSVVSTSPQQGFLHQVSELDTLGVDQPETKCTLK